MKNKVKRILILIAFFFLGITSVDADTIRCDKYLSKGYSGEEVKKLQGMLNNTMNCNLQIDGIFGNLTKTCVKNFQYKYNLTVDGIVGKNTCTVLNSVANGGEVSTNNNSNVQNNNTSNNETVQSTSVSGYAFVSGDIVNVRKSYTTDSPVLTTVKLGKKVELISKTGAWYKVKVGKTKGYIREDLLTTDDIIVDISDQKLYFYKEGKKVFTSKVVTGMKDKHDTPIGKYKLYVANKVEGMYLKEFDTYVHYWMPFIMSRGIGFHDSDKRQASDYTKDRYTYDGSHACVNMTKKKAKKLYELLDKDTIVIVRK